MMATLRRVLLATLTFLLLPASASATWSIVVIDRATGRMVIASATCVPQGSFARFPAKGLMDVQAIIVPGYGIAAAQAGVDNTRANQMLIYEELKKGTHPSAIIQQLMADPRIQNRQFGIVDIQGRFSGFSGARNGAASNDVQGQIPGTEIFYSVQGNILKGNDVVQNAVRALEGTQGSLTDRVMAAMEAADRAGGDSRCTCESSPAPKVTCTNRTAHVAYMLAAEKTDAVGTSHNDGSYSMYINVTDEDIQPDENANPVITLRKRYDVWKARQPGGS